LAYLIYSNFINKNELWKSNPRRPTPVVTAWSPSDIAEKYNRLLDKLLSIAELTEQQLKRNVEFEEQKRKMEMQFLQLELEYANAVANNNMVGDIGKISVIFDGGWSHRSHGHRYTAKSVVAIIIGVHTKKNLFMGVRNKYCSICAMAMRKGTTIPTHVCFKN
jgi:3-dehydroquinate dehydratase